MLRRTLTTLSLIGLLLSVGLWERSYGAVYVNTVGHNSSGHGTLMLYRARLAGRVAETLDEIEGHQKEYRRAAKERQESRAHAHREDLVREEVEVEDRI